MLRMITGRNDRTRPSMLNLINNEITKRINAGEDHLILIVPEQFTLGAEQALIHKSHTDGLFNVDVMSLSRLRTRVFSEVGMPDGVAVNEHGRQMVLVRSLMDCKNTLEIYSHSAGQTGFQQKMAVLVDEIKSNRMRYGDLNDVIKRLKGKNVLTRKLEDVQKIMLQYDNVMGNDHYDDNDLSEMAAQAIEHSHQIAQSKIYFNGFHTFSESDFLIISKLIKCAKEVTMTLVTDNVNNGTDGMIFEIAEETKNRLCEIAKGAGQDVEIIDAGAFAEKSGIISDISVPADLIQLERECFAAVPKPNKTAPENIQICECSDLRSEAEKAAQKIVQLTRDEGFRYRDIGVLVGSPEMMGDTIKHVFGLYDIPCFVDAAKSMDSQPLIHFIVAALEAVERRFDTQTVLAFGKSAFSPISASDMMDLENYAIVMGIHHSRWTEAFEKSADDMPRSITELNEIRETLMAPLITLKQDTKDAQTYHDYLMAVIHFLAESHIPEKLDTFSEEAQTHQDFSKASVDNQIWNILMTVLEQIEAALAAQSCTSKEFIQVFKNGVSTYDIGIIPDHPDVIDITDPLRSRHLCKKVMIIIGANEGLLPLETDPFPILSERERREILNAGLDLHHTRHFDQVQGAYMLYLQISSVAEKLFVYYGTTGDKGEVLRRSRLVNQILNVFPTMPIHSALLFDPDTTFDWITGSQATETIAKAETNKDMPIAQEVAKRFDLAHEVRNNAQASAMFFTLDDGIANELTDSKLILSPTDAEAYNACAWRYFIQKELKPIKREAYEITFPDIGNIMHMLFERFFAELKAMGKRIEDLTATERDHMVNRILDELFGKVHYAVINSNAAYRYQGRKLKRMGRRTMGMIAEHMKTGGFQYVDGEHRFEMPIDSKGLTKPAVIQGSIDRVDRMDADGTSYYKIIDYKTGYSGIKPSDIYYGLLPQLLTYLDASVNEASKHGNIVKPAAGFYFRVDDPITDITNGKDAENEGKKAYKMHGISLNDEIVQKGLDQDNEKTIYSKGLRGSALYNEDEMQAVLKHNRNMYKKDAKAILSGQIAPNPCQKKEETACDHCRYKEICGFVHETTTFRKLDESMTKQELLAKIEEENKGGKL